MENLPSLQTVLVGDMGKSPNLQIALVGAMGKPPNLQIILVGAMGKPPSLQTALVGAWAKRHASNNDQNPNHHPKFGTTHYPSTPLRVRINFSL